MFLGILSEARGKQTNITKRFIFIAKHRELSCDRSLNSIASSSGRSQSSEFNANAAVKRHCTRRYVNLQLAANKSGIFQYKNMFNVLQQWRKKNIVTTSCFMLQLRLHTFTSED